MITVDTINPVYSSANGRRTKPVKAQSTTPSNRDTRQANRDLRQANRKAKRNAPKLKKVRRKSGKTSFVMKLIKLVPVGKQRFSGVDGSSSKPDLIAFQQYVINVKGDKTILGKGGSTGFGDDGIWGAKSKLAWDKYGKEFDLSKVSMPSPTATANDFTKTFPDGTTIVIPASDVINHSSGVFDKNDIAKALGVAKETLTPDMIEKYLVYIAPAPTNSDSANETPKSATSDVAIEVPADKVTETPDGSFLTTDTQDPNEPTKDVAVEQKQEQAPLKKYEKIILWGGVALVVIIAGVIIYRKMSKGGSKGK